MSSSAVRYPYLCLIPFHRSAEHRQVKALRRAEKSAPQSAAAHVAALADDLYRRDPEKAGASLLVMATKLRKQKNSSLNATLRATVGEREVDGGNAALRTAREHLMLKANIGGIGAALLGTAIGIIVTSIFCLPWAQIAPGFPIPILIAAFTVAGMLAVAGALLIAGTLRSSGHAKYINALGAADLAPAVQTLDPTMQLFAMSV